MRDCKVNILGTEWEIVQRDEKADKLLEGRDGYSDLSTHRIVISNKREDCELEDYEGYKNTVLRHEIIHAFLYESGLDASASICAEAWPTNEEMVDWFAIQSPKIFRLFTELGIL